MIEFVDGPASGVSLRLFRTPIMLRVVRSQKGEWDALDQVDDSPKPDEAICVYKMQAFRGRAFICRRPKSASGLYLMATYSYFADQPTDAECRSNEAWGEWCKQQFERLSPEERKKIVLPTKETP